MKFVNFAIVRFSGFLVAGILVAHYFPITIFISEFLIASLIGACLLWYLARHQLIQNIYFGTVVYLCFFTIGYLSYQAREPNFQPKHYLNSASPENHLIELKIRESIKPDPFNTRYFADVQAIDGKSSKGKILVSISNNNEVKSYLSDEILLVYTPILEIPKSLNPHQFDYANYLKNLEVYGQIRISHKDILLSKIGSKTVFGQAQNFRAQAINKLKMTEISPDERAIIQALVLGEKKDISKQLYEEYAAAGAVHILAVSGLHVGILFYILGFVFNPLKRWKYGAILHSIIIVVLLWGFALLSGLSPSVTRAVTMFSFFALAQILARRTSSINTLFLSFLTLLIINPMWLFQVGFQLSYLAVFFILWLNPLLYKVTYSKHKILRKAKGIIGVTISAQLGVLPLSLYYFHQFPGLFLLTNIVVLPALSIYMVGGIIIVLLSLFEALPNWLAATYNFMVEWLNAFIHWVAVQDNFLFKDIHFSNIKVFATYLLIFTSFLYLRKMEHRKLSLALLSVIILISVYIFDDYKTSTSEVVIFHKYKATIIGHKNGSKLNVFKKDSGESLRESFPIKAYKVQVGTKKYLEAPLPNVFRVKQKNIVLVDSHNVLPKQQKINMVLLSESPRINMNRLIDSLNPEQIIADGSNFPSYVRRWKESCESKKLPFHYTGEQGAFVIK
jgi:competence protein ComEC